MKKKKLIIGISAFIVAFLIFRIVMIRSAAMPKTHTDSSHYFSIKVPSTWTSQEHIATEKTGIGTANEESHEIEISSFYSSYGAGVNVQVYKTKPQCDSAQRPNTTLAGLPAYYDDQRKQWIMKTTDAMYVVNYAYPGLHVGFGHTARDLTPVPSEAIQQYKQLVEFVVNSFVPTIKTPLNCQ